VTKFLLAVHVLAAIIAIGPVTVAASMFTAAVRRALASPGDDQALAVVRILHRICRVYAAVGVFVPVFGFATANSLARTGRRLADRLDRPDGDRGRRSGVARAASAERDPGRSRHRRPTTTENGRGAARDRTACHAPAKHHRDERLCTWASSAAIAALRERIAVRVSGPAAFYGFENPRLRGADRATRKVVEAGQRCGLGNDG